MGYMKISLKRYGRRRGMSGLGDACSEYGGTTNADGTCHVAIAGPGSEIAITGSGGSVPPQQQASGSSWFDSLMKGVAGVVGQQQTPQPVYVAPQSGISTTTIVIGGVALVGIALLLRRRS